MSPFELQALRYVGEGLPDRIKPEHRDLLTRMQLAELNGGGSLEITEAGRKRLAAEQLRRGGGQ